MLFPALVLLRLFDRFSKFQPETVVVSLHKVSFHKVSLILCPEDVDAPLGKMVGAPWDGALKLKHQPHLHLGLMGIYWV